jgi:3D (Asp-Asp-Asp) domain-containing protein
MSNRKSDLILASALILTVLACAAFVLLSLRATREARSSRPNYDAVGEMLVKLDSMERATYRGHPSFVTPPHDIDELDATLSEQLPQVDTRAKAVRSGFEPEIDNYGVGNYGEIISVKSLGRHKITGYDPWCVHCRGEWPVMGITASGRMAVVGRTVAMYGGIPFGTEVYISGLGYFIVDDRGVGKGAVDVAVNNHADAYALTSRRDVYIIERAAPP